MVTTALLLLLAGTPDARPAFLVDGAPRRMRLVQDAPPPIAQQAPDYARWTRGQLQAEYDHLDSLRPGLGLPIGLIAGGGGAAIVDLYVLLLALAGNSRTLLPLFIALGVAGVISAGLIVLGVILLTRALPERRAIGLQMDEVDRWLNGRGDEYAPPRPPPPDGAPNDIVVPPPPPLPGDNVSIPVPQILIARF